MVYLREVLKNNSDKLLEHKNIEGVAYLYCTSPEYIEHYDFDLTPEEEISLYGYINKPVEKDRVVTIVSKPARKGISATTSNIFKFAGLYLAAKDVLKSTLIEKYHNSDLKQKYFLSKIEPSFHQNLILDPSLTNNDPISIIVKNLLGQPSIEGNDLNEALSDIVKKDLDVQTQILLEDLEKKLLQYKYLNKNSEELIRDLLVNFPNAVRKITTGRRKNHPHFDIKDEYDVQDILYVIIKSIFPEMKDEDAIAKVGGKATRIDFILREDGILIEAKMIKEKDANEINFIEELKIDFESYHQCPWIKKLFCFVYDPYKKTKDIANFNDLNGNRTKGNHSYNVELIVVD